MGFITVWAGVGGATLLDIPTNRNETRQHFVQLQRTKSNRKVTRSEMVDSLVLSREFLILWEEQL